ncbi:MAG: FAD-dependent oxidoreductase, partial [Candidatus Kerfeldbacteria bacterium]|nr:FAD-dependent oxidoreductase [Candidatus Kerfeldbacteria bacterium]
YGLFTFDEQRMPHADFFAGGIGITPFLSMIRYATDQKLPNHLTLLYMNKTRQDISYFDELQALAAQNEHFRVVFGVDQIDDPSWNGERGLVTRGMIERSCRTFAGKTFFLCGPKPFMDTTRQHLVTCGVQPKDIKVEIFT